MVQKLLRFKFFSLLLLALCGGMAASAQTPTYFYAGGTGNNVIPFGFAGIADKAQWLYTPAEWNTAPLSGNINKVYFKTVTTVSSITFTNLTIKLALPGVTTLPSGAVPWLPATTVYQQTTTFTGVVANGWISVNLTTPFFYSGTVPLLVDVQQGGYTGGGLTIPQGTIAGSQRRLYGLLANPNSNGSDGTLAPFGFDIVPACTGVPTTPTVTTPIQSQPICANGTATITATNSGGPSGMTYQWEQSSSATGPWSNATGGSGATTLAYTTPALTTTTFYRLKAVCGLPTNAVYTTAYRVAVGPLAPGPITGFDTLACLQSPQVYSVAPVFGTNTYNWTLPPGFTGSSNTNSITVMPGTSNGTISVTATGNCGTSTASSKAVKIIINPALFPNATITYDEPLEFCEGSAIVLTANQQGGGLKYQWFRDTVALPGADSFSFIANVTGMYKVYESNNYGCRDSSEPLSVTVNPKPVPVIMRNNLTLSTGAFVTYQWYYNGQPIPGATNASTSMNANGIYTVLVTDTNGCENRSVAYFMGNLAVWSTGIAATDVRLFPNPAKNVLNVQAPGKVNLFIRAVDGRLLMHSIGGKSMDVSPLPAGVYTVLITDTEGRTVKTEKLVKTAE